MAHEKSENIYNQLNRCTHSTYDDNPPTLFSGATITSECEYWLFSDLYNLFAPLYMGHHDDIDTIGRDAINRKTFEKIRRHNSDNERIPQNFYNFYTGHIATIHNNYQINDGNQTINKTNAPDAKLTRYACWSIMRQWPRQIFTQTYFMMPNATFGDIYNQTYQYARISLRDELARAEHMVNGIAHRNHANMRHFHYYMHRAFFYGRDANDIKIGHDIPIYDNDPLSNYMGAQSLLSRRRGICNAIATWDATPHMRFERFADILYEELVSARVRMIQKTGTTPEQDIFKKSVTNISREFKNAEQKFIQQFAPQVLQR